MSKYNRAKQYLLGFNKTRHVPAWRVWAFLLGIRSAGLVDVRRAPRIRA